MLNEINDQAGQHEVVAENLTVTVAKEIVALVKDLKDERKRVSNFITLPTFYLISLFLASCGTFDDCGIYLFMFQTITFRYCLILSLQYYFPRCSGAL